jgi:hypothetical protein
MKICHAALAVALIASPLAAQESSVAAPSAGAPVPMVVSAVQTPQSVLRTGTELSLTLLHELTTKGKNLRVGDRVRLEVADPLLIDGTTVIPQGAPVAAEVTEVRNKGMWGRSGRFVVRLLNVNVNGRQIRLGGTFDDKGVAGGWGAAAVSALVFLPAGFFMTGTSALLPAGTTVKGFIDEDVPLILPAAAPPAPLTVGEPIAAVAPISVSAPQNLEATREAGLAAAAWSRGE